MVFKDREEAAYLLLLKLKKYQGQDIVVFGIPRGAMPMAKIIADGLGAPLNAVLVHKIPHPDSSEFAVGCVGISGTIHRLSYVKNYHIPESYIQSAAKIQLEVLAQRRKKYGLVELSIKDKTVILVDDGIATGATTICAISEIRSKGASKIILATAVSTSEASKKIIPMVDEFIALDIPAGFYSVSQFFLNFPQVTDEEVVALLQSQTVSESITHV
jgi:predicted phosphoribosyltransferase